MRSRSIHQGRPRCKGDRVGHLWLGSLLHHWICPVFFHRHRTTILFLHRCRAWPTADIDNNALRTFKLFFVRRPRPLFRRAGRFHPANLFLTVLCRKTNMVETSSAAPICGQWKNRKYLLNHHSNRWSCPSASEPLSCP